jgi:hypothetical protein
MRRVWRAGVAGGIGALLFAAWNARAQENASPQVSQGTTRPAAPEAPLEGRPARADLERQLERDLSGVTLRGYFQMTGAEGLKGQAELSEPRREKYTILAANRADGDWWLLRARIEYGEHDVELPVRLRVVWAEETPIITMDQVFFPGLGTYSARVMIFRGFYAGTWFGDGYGGVLSGQIVRLDAQDPPDGEENKKP